MPTDHRNRPIGNPRTPHGGHMPFPDASYWREGNTWSTTSALKRLSNVSKNMPPESWSPVSGHTATVALEIWNNPHPKEYR